MSVVVAVISGAGAAVATDSLHVAMSGTAPDMSSGHVKHAQAGHRAAGIVGVADFDGHQLNSWVSAALARAQTLSAVPAELLRLAGTDLVAGYRRWRNTVGEDPAPEEFLTVLVVESHPGRVEALIARTAVVEDSLTLLIDRHTTFAETNVLVIGAADAALLAHTEDGRMLRLAATLQQRPSPVPAVAALPDHLFSHECELQARRLVAEAVAREKELPRPAWWPPGLPVLADPVHAVRVPTPST